MSRSTYETGLSVTFQASHSLKGDFGPACQVHAHDYRVDVSVFGDALTQDGILIDITLLEHAVTSIIDRWSFECLDFVPELIGINTTVESLARALHDQVRAALRERDDLTMEIKVWESPTVWGSYRSAIHD